jgi:hypothetical protein
MAEDDRLAWIKSRAHAATPGPWLAHDRGNGWEIAVTDERDEYGRPARLLPEGLRTDIGRREDAEFIAHSRADVDWLVSEVERLRAVLAEQPDWVTLIAAADLTWAHGFGDEPSQPAYIRHVARCVAAGRALPYEAAPSSSDAPNKDTGERPRVVCLSGSMRFFDHILTVAAENTAAGRIVLAPFSVVAPEDQDGEFKRMLDELHFRKIDTADEVIVVTVDGYIGESTRNEIAYAEQLGKPVWYEDFTPGQPDVVKIELPAPPNAPNQTEVADSELPDLEMRIGEILIDGSLVQGRNPKELAADSNALAEKVMAEVAPALSDAYLRGHDAGFAAANVADPWAGPVADSELRDKTIEANTLRNQLGVVRRQLTWRNREYGRASATIGQLRGELARNRAQNADYLRSMIQRRERERDEALAELADIHGDDAPSRIDLAAENERLRADLETLKAKASTKWRWQTAPISEVMHLVPVGEGRRETACGQTASTTWRDPVEGEPFCAECTFGSSGQPDTEATEQASERDAALHEALQEDAEVDRQEVQAAWNTRYQAHYEERRESGRDTAAAEREAVRLTTEELGPDPSEQSVTPATPTEPRPVYHGPGDVQYEYDEDDNPINPSVGWNIAWGCRVSFGYYDDAWRVTVSVSDAERRNGGAIRSVTREHLRKLAHHLIELTEVVIEDGAPTQPRVWTEFRAGERATATDLDGRTVTGQIIAYFAWSEELGRNSRARMILDDDTPAVIHAPSLTEVTEVVTPTEPRVWRKRAAQTKPPESVHRIRDCDGYAWVAKDNHWSSVDRAKELFTWGALLLMYGPLTEVVGDQAPGGEA